jgi:hypothetical protein
VLTRTTLQAPAPMTDDEQLERLTDRFERRLSEELGKFRLEVRDECGKTRLQIAELRSEIGRDMLLLKWLLGLFAAQTAALGALMAAFR